MSNRNLSILDFLKQLQTEYLLYELRIKIYPSSEDKAKFRGILEYKENKIIDICKKNSLDNMFTNGDILKEIEEEFYDQFGNPKNLSNRDKYFYLWIGADFSFKGRGVKLVSYDFESMTCVIKDHKETNQDVDLNFIRRIL
jgi:hypothetical protein